MKNLIYSIIVIALFGYVGTVERGAEKEIQKLKDTQSSLQGQIWSWEDRAIVQESNTEAIINDYYTEMFK